MTPYRDWDNDSGVRAYDIGQSHIDVQFKDGAVYRYTSLSAGQQNLDYMARLAQAGDGLNSFINRNVRRRYSARLRWGINMATAKEIAEWILAQMPEKSLLYQERVARGIRQQFGEEHTYRNPNGNWAINKNILTEFRKLTPDDIVWSRSEQGWRRRRPNDPASRMVS